MSYILHLFEIKHRVFATKLVVYNQFGHKRVIVYNDCFNIAFEYENGGASRKKFPWQLWSGYPNETTIKSYFFYEYELLIEYSLACKHIYSKAELYEEDLNVYCNLIVDNEKHKIEIPYTKYMDSMFSNVNLWFSISSVIRKLSRDVPVKKKSSILKYLLLSEFCILTDIINIIKYNFISCCYPKPIIPEWFIDLFNQ
jgi:hypothetical protein